MTKTIPGGTLFGTFADQWEMVLSLQVAWSCWPSPELPRGGSPPENKANVEN